MTAEELSKAYPPLSQIRLIVRLVEISDAKKAFDVSDPSSPQCAGFEAHGIRNAEDFLLELASAGIIDFEVVGDEGFAPARFGRLTPQTFDYLRRLVAMVDGQIKGLDSRVEALLAFRPTEILEEIRGTESSLDKMIALSAANPDLEPLIRHLKSFAAHVKSIKAIAANYDDVYKIIIRPIQDEGRAGVKATSLWAIASVIVSAVISLAISTCHSIKQRDSVGAEVTAPSSGIKSEQTVGEVVAIIHDRSASVHDGCTAFSNLTSRVLKHSDYEKSELLILATGDMSSKNEPILARPDAPYIIVHDLFESERQKSLLQELTAWCHSLTPANVSPLLLAIDRATEELRNRDYSSAKLLVQSDMLEDVDSELTGLIEKPSKAPLSKLIDNSGISVHFCGYADAESLGRASKNVKEAWLAEFSNPKLVTFEPFCLAN